MDKSFIYDNVDSLTPFLTPIINIHFWVLAILSYYKGICNKARKDKNWLVFAFTKKSVDFCVVAGLLAF